MLWSTNSRAFIERQGGEVSEAELFFVEVQVLVLICLKAACHGHCCEKHEEKKHGDDVFRLHDFGNTVVGCVVEWMGMSLEESMTVC